MLRFLVVQIKKQLIACLDRHNKISKQSYKAGLTKHAKSSTNAVSQRVEEQRQERYNAAAELLDGIESHRLWLSEACDLKYVTAVQDRLISLVVVNDLMIIQ